MESVVRSHYKMHRSLTAHCWIELHDHATIRTHRVAQLFIEGRLIIQSGSRTQRPSLIPFRDIANRQARRDERLVVPVAVCQSHTRCHVEQTMRGNMPPSIL